MISSDGFEAHRCKIEKTTTPYLVSSAVFLTKLIPDEKNMIAIIPTTINVVAAPV